MKTFRSTIIVLLLLLLALTASRTAQADHKDTDSLRRQVTVTFNPRDYLRVAEAAENNKLTIAQYIAQTALQTTTCP